jgi:hypothetical protein
MTDTIVGVLNQTTCSRQDFPAEGSCGNNCPPLGQCPFGPNAGQQPTPRCKFTGEFRDWGPCITSCCLNCPFQQVCCEPETGLCPNIGGLPPVGFGWYRNDPEADAERTRTSGGICQPTGSRQMTCIYNVSQFKTAADVDQYRRVFLSATNANNIAINNNQLDTKLYPTYCGVVTQECQDYNQVKGPACEGGLTGGCSRLVSTGRDGALCKEWQGTNPGLALVTADNYCAQSGNICKPDCQCYNRDKHVDAIYDKIIGDGTTTDLPVAAHCWYTACQNPTRILVPENQTPIKTPCPTFICSQVTNIIVRDINDFTIPEWNQSQECSQFSPTGSTGSDATVSFWDRYGMWILIGTGVFLVVIIIFIIIGLVSGQRSNNQETKDNKDENIRQNIDPLGRTNVENQTVITT